MNTTFILVSWGNKFEITNACHWCEYPKLLRETCNLRATNPSNTVLKVLQSEHCHLGLDTLGKRLCLPRTQHSAEVPPDTPYRSLSQLGTAGPFYGWRNQSFPGFFVNVQTAVKGKTPFCSAWVFIALYTTESCYRLNLQSSQDLSLQSSATNGRVDFGFLLPEIKSPDLFLQRCWAPWVAFNAVSTWGDIKFNVVTPCESF